MMGPLNKLFCDNLNANTYWHPFDYRNNWNQTPEKPGKYQVMIYFILSDIMIMAEAEWTGKEWMYQNCECVTRLVRCWMEKIDVEGCGWID